MMNKDNPTLSSRNRDRDGRKLLVFCVGKHIKGTEKMEDMKKFFVYYLERLARLLTDPVFYKQLCH